MVILVRYRFTVIGAQEGRMKQVTTPFDFLSLRSPSLVVSSFVLDMEMILCASYCLLFFCYRLVCLTAVVCAVVAKSCTLVLCPGLGPQEFKLQKVIAEKEQTTTGIRRSNARANVTIVGTTNATGNKIPLLLLSKGQKV